jgi:ATP-dependent helicase/nuclease subunit A
MRHGGVPIRSDSNEVSVHNVVMRALEGRMEAHLDKTGDIRFYRWQDNQEVTIQPAEKAEEDAEASPAMLPEWVDQQLLPEPKLPRPLTPSGAQALIDVQNWQSYSPLSDGKENPSGALRRGTAIHRLLQMLPDMGDNTSLEETALIRKNAASRYLCTIGPEWSSEETDQILNQVFSILDNPAFAPLFHPGASRAEVAISGAIELISGPRLVSGQIDRLIVDDKQVTIIDYKTNRTAPQQASDIPPSYLSQLTLYRHLVRLIYPDHQVKAAILWTEIPRLDFISPVQLDAAFTKIAQA